MTGGCVNACHAGGAGWTYLVTAREVCRLLPNKPRGKDRRGEQKGGGPREDVALMRTKLVRENEENKQREGTQEVVQLVSVGRH